MLTLIQTELTSLRLRVESHMYQQLITDSTQWPVMVHWTGTGDITSHIQRYQFKTTRNIIQQIWSVPSEAIHFRIVLFLVAFVWYLAHKLLHFGGVHEEWLLPQWPVSLKSQFGMQFGSQSSKQFAISNYLKSTNWYMTIVPPHDKWPYHLVNITRDSSTWPKRQQPNF